MTQTDKAAEAKPEVELRVTWAKQDREFWLHMCLPDGKSAGINLGDPDGMITSAALRACVGHTFSTHPQDAESLRAENERVRAEVVRRSEMHECAMAERDDCILDWSDTKAERDRLAAEVKRMEGVIDWECIRRREAESALATSRAETAALAERVRFYTGHTLQQLHRVTTVAGGGKPLAIATNCVDELSDLALTEHYNGAALAARDKATREQALREAANMGHAHADLHTRESVRRAILSLIQEENQ